MATFTIAPRKAVAHGGRLYYHGQEDKLVAAMGKEPNASLLAELRRKKVVLTEAEAEKYAAETAKEQPDNAASSGTGRRTTR